MSSGSVPGFRATTAQVRDEQVEVLRCRDGRSERTADHISIEEPLEIRIAGAGFEEMPLAITMRTPGSDDELTLGFLYSEGIIRSIADVDSLEHCRPPSPGKSLHNSMRVTLAQDLSFTPAQLARHFYTTSSCGVCGKTSIDSVMDRALATIGNSFHVAPDKLSELPARLREQQTDFALTGGIHAAALIEESGELSQVREDIGRHNAVDKLIGACLLGERLPLAGCGLMLSGRAGFELVQKAAMAGAELVAAIGPPSSLSVELAEQCGLTLAGFVSADGYNLYSHPKRVR